MRATPFDELISPDKVKSTQKLGRGIYSSVSGPLDNKFLDSMGGEVISGKRALSKQMRLQNNGHVKRMFNGYIKGNLMQDRGRAYGKTSFVPFVDERDHLGQLIDSDVRTELGRSKYIKKLVVFKPRTAGQNGSHQIEIREDIPRRWLERVGQYSEGAQNSGRRSSYTKNQIPAEYAS